MTRTREMWPHCNGGVRIRDRVFTQNDLVYIRRLIRQHPSWGRTKLSCRICKDDGWFQSNGRLKERACRVALLKLQKLGYLRLPPRKTPTGGRPPEKRDLSLIIDIPAKTVSMPPELRLERVKNRRESILWNAAISSYHYLGLSTPVGRTLRYLVYSDNTLLAAISFGESAWDLAARKTPFSALGLPYCRAPQFVIMNNRFLILPWVKVRNLASRILAMATCRATRDWENLFNIRPLIAETFVDPTRFSGACYLAANWLVAGVSRGYRKQGSAHYNSQTPKLILLRGLNSRIQNQLQNLYRGSGK